MFFFNSAGQDLVSFWVLTKLVSELWY